jgi:hypothetical protein
MHSHELQEKCLRFQKQLMYERVSTQADSIGLNIPTLVSL